MSCNCNRLSGCWMHSLLPHAWKSLMNCKWFLCYHHSYTRCLTEDALRNARSLFCCPHSLSVHPFVSSLLLNHEQKAPALTETCPVSQLTECTVYAWMHITRSLICRFYYSTNGVQNDPPAGSPDLTSALCDLELWPQKLIYKKNFLNFAQDLKFGRGWRVVCKILRVQNRRILTSLLMILFDRR